MDLSITGVIGRCYTIVSHLAGAYFLTGNYVKQIQVEDGAIHVTLGNKVHKQVEGKILSIQPLVVSGSPASPISWNCGNASPPEGMEAVGTNRTDIAGQFVASACRSG